MPWHPQALVKHAVRVANRPPARVIPAAPGPHRETHGTGLTRTPAGTAVHQALGLQRTPGLTWKGGNFDLNQAATLLYQVGLSKPEAVKLSSILGSESGGNPRASNPTSGARGLFQVMTSRDDKEWGWDDLLRKSGAKDTSTPDSGAFDPVVNARAAAQIFRNAGDSLGPWAGAPGASGRVDPRAKQGSLAKGPANMPGGGGKGMGAVPPAAPPGTYVNPYKGLAKTEIDRGVDFAGTGKVGAIGKARVVDATTSSPFWSGYGGGNVGYKLLKGPRKGWTVFVAEHVTPTVKPGQVVRKGQPVGQVSGGIETGWAAKPGTKYVAGGQPLANALGDPHIGSRHEAHEGGDTKPDPGTDPATGIDFNRFLAGKPGMALGGGGGAVIPSGGVGSPAGGAYATAVGGGSTDTEQQALTSPAPPAFHPVSLGSGGTQATGLKDIAAGLQDILSGGAPGSSGSGLDQILNRRRGRRR